MAIIANGQRFDTNGRRIEDCEFSINQVGDSVYLHVQGAKRLQSWMLPAEEWQKLVTVAPRPGIERRAYACCSDHSTIALHHMSGRNVEIRKVDDDDNRYSCFCGKRADFYMMER